MSTETSSRNTTDFVNDATNRLNEVKERLSARSQASKNSSTISKTGS